MNSITSGWLVLTRNFVAGSHPQNDTLFVVFMNSRVPLTWGGRFTMKCMEGTMGG
jgi:hypothetical protein